MLEPVTGLSKSYFRYFLANMEIELIIPKTPEREYRAKMGSIYAHCGLIECLGIRGLSRTICEDTSLVHLSRR